MERSRTRWIGTVSVEDILLDPDVTEQIELDTIECSQGMARKMFDVKFNLYEVEIEELLDELTRAPLVTGSVVGHWVF
jgi:hypothetical protein